MEFGDTHEIDSNSEEIENEALNELDTIPMNFMDQRLDDVQYVSNLLEAILLMSPEPIEIGRISKSLGIKKAVIQNAIDRLKSIYQSRGIIIQEIGDGHQFGTNPDIAEHIEKFFQLEKKRKISRAALQTLSIIAYNQPVTRAEIEVFRGGINSDGVISSLLERELIKIAGRKETPGNPYLYSVSDPFLQYFGLKDIEDLKAKLPAIEDEIASDGGIAQLKLRELGIKSGSQNTDEDEPDADSNGSTDEDFAVHSISADDEIIDEETQ